MSSFWLDIKQDTCQNLSSLVQPFLTHAEAQNGGKSSNNKAPPPPKPKTHKAGKHKTTLKRNNESPKQPPKPKKTKKKLTLDNLM